MPRDSCFKNMASGSNEVPGRLATQTLKCAPGKGSAGVKEFAAGLVGLLRSIDGAPTPGTPDETGALLEAARRYGIEILPPPSN